MRSIAAVSLSAVLVSVAWGQGGTRTKNAPEQAPVTKREAAETISKVRAAVHKVILRKAASAYKWKPGAGPVTRSELIMELSKLLKESRPSFKYTPIMAAYRASDIVVPVGNPARKPLEELLAWGFIGKVDPLATSTRDTFTPTEFGHTLGYFLSRLCELSHTPSTKFSPMLMGEG